MSFLKKFHNEKNLSNEPDEPTTHEKVKQPLNSNELIKEVYAQQTPLTDNDHVVPKQYEDAYQDNKNAQQIEIDLPKNDKFNDLYQETFETKEDDEMADDINNLREQIQIEQRNMNRFERGSQEWLSSNQRLRQLRDQLVNMLTNPQVAEDNTDDEKDEESNVVDNQPTSEENRQDNIVDNDVVVSATPVDDNSSNENEDDDIDIKDITSLPKEQLNGFLENLRINKPDAYNQLINSMNKLEKLASAVPASAVNSQVNSYATSAVNPTSTVSDNNVQPSQAATSETTVTPVKPVITDEQTTPLNNNRVSISQLDIPVFDNVFKEHSYLTINQQFLKDISNILVRNDRVLLATNDDNIICLMKTSAFSKKNTEPNFIYLLCDQFDEYRQKLISLLNGFGNVSVLHLLGMRYTIHHDK